MLHNVLNLAATFTTTTSGGNATLGVALLLTLFIGGLILYLFFAFCMAKIFNKAGRPGWPAYVPIYNTWVYFEIGGKPGWVVLLSFLGLIPLAGIFISIAVMVISIMVSIEVSKRFGKGVAFAIFLLILLPFIGLPMLAFGESEYRDPTGQPGSPLATTPQVSGPAPMPGAPITTPTVASPGVVLPQPGMAPSAGMPPGPMAPTVPGGPVPGQPPIPTVAPPAAPLTDNSQPPTPPTPPTPPSPVI